MANTKHKPTKGKPISSHPLFPAVVALWFGALFGLGSLAIRPTLIEGLVLKTGVDLIVPAAAPPLGVTARILIALVMASAGAAIGAVLALRINRPKVEVRERKRNAASPGAAAEAEAALWNSRDVFSDGPARRPISAHEELGETLDHAGPLVGRRRPLAVEHKEEPFQPHELAPLPGGELQIFDIAATQLDPVSLETVAEDPAPLDLGAFPAPPPVAPFAPFAGPTASLASAAPFAPPSEPIEPGFSPMVEREVPVIAEAASIFGVAAQDGHVPVDFVRAAGFRTSVFETEAPQPLFAERAGPEAVVQPDEQVPAPAAEAVAPPASLGMTDLARRLQESMARRRAAKSGSAMAVEIAPTPAMEPALAEPEQPAFVPPPPIFTAPAPVMAEAPAIPPAPIPMPAALRPVSFDPIEDDDHGDIAGLVPRHLAMPVQDTEAPANEEPVADLAETCTADRVDEPAAEPETTGPDDDAFASLLTIEMPRQEFVRVEEPLEPVAAIEPVVIFPGQMAASAPAPLRPFDAPAAALPGAPVAQVAHARAIPEFDPAEAQLALRSALANLQRISGAA